MYNIMPIKGKVVFDKRRCNETHECFSLSFFLYIRIREMLNENKNGKKQSPHPLQFTTITP
jgi:hypothetical protein